MSMVPPRARSAATCRLVWLTWDPTTIKPCSAAPARRPDLLATKRRLGPEAAQGPHERRPGAKQKRLACALGQQHAAGHRLQVGVFGGVDDDPRPVLHVGQQIARPGTARRA